MASKLGMPVTTSFSGRTPLRMKKSRYPSEATQKYWYWCDRPLVDVLAK